MTVTRPRVIHPRFAPATRLVWQPGVLGALEIIARHGFQAAEVWAQHLWESQVSPDAVAARARELGLKLSLHAPSYDLNPLASNPEIRFVSQRQVLDSFEAAAIMGAQVVVVHPGAVSSSTDDLEIYWARLRAYVETLNDRARSLGLTVGIESMERKKLQFVTRLDALERLAQMLDDLGGAASNIAITLDVAHARTNGDPMAFIQRTPHVGHAHLSDSSPTKTHALMGEGELDLDQIVPALLARIERTEHGLIAIEGRYAADEERALELAAHALARFSAVV
jgi:sugar phosphate isomerase/epimerase